LQAESGVVVGISCSKADERDQLMEGLHDFAKALPQELSLHVLSFLDASDLISVSSVCRTWNLLANDDYVWKCLLQFQRELTNFRCLFSILDQTERFLEHCKATKVIAFV
jgi:hypothetical protein